MGPELIACQYYFRHSLTLKKEGENFTFFLSMGYVFYKKKTRIFVLLQLDLTVNSFLVRLVQTNNIP